MSGWKTLTILFLKDQKHTNKKGDNEVTEKYLLTKSHVEILLRELGCYYIETYSYSSLLYKECLVLNC